MHSLMILTTETPRIAHNWEHFSTVYVLGGGGAFIQLTMHELLFTLYKINTKV